MWLCVFQTKGGFSTGYDCIDSYWILECPNITNSEKASEIDKKCLLAWKKDNAWRSVDLACAELNRLRIGYFRTVMPRTFRTCSSVLS